MSDRRGKIVNMMVEGTPKSEVSERRRKNVTHRMVERAPKSEMSEFGRERIFA